jgi:hypothetical protein
MVVVVVVVVALEVGQGVGHGTVMIMDHAFAWPELLRVILGWFEGVVVVIIVLTLFVLPIRRYLYESWYALIIAVFTILFDDFAFNNCKISLLSDFIHNLFCYSLWKICVNPQ